MRERKSASRGVDPSSRPQTADIITTDLLNHPAVWAWGQVQREHRRPAGVQILKGLGRKSSKSVVYRIAGVGANGSDVIAKRCPQLTLELERTIYEKILPHLPVCTLRYYGAVEEPSTNFGWLFLEDAGECSYSADIEEHRSLAAQYLGAMHVSAAGIVASASLPDRDPGHYLEHLQSGREAIVRNLTNPALTAVDVEMLEAIVSQLDVLKRDWGSLERYCHTMPRSLVHGDFVGKNVRLKRTRAGIVLLPFDWETAGWGVPAPDLEGLWAVSDAAVYWSSVRDVWSDLGIEGVQRLAIIGRIFRCLAAIRWESEGLWLERVDQPLRSMRIYVSRLAESLRGL
ncbi:MAG: phosphotransferase [Chloroflexi bacterium]|nr:phosphotransferase [Chloroflexota bacterium]